MNILDLKDWHTPASDYPRKRIGRAELTTFPYKRGLYEMYMVDGYTHFRALNPLGVTNLKIARRIWMVDDPPHWLAMREHAAAFRGHVVCAGLGLGLMLHWMADNPRISKITVVEREPDVIQLIKPYVPDCEIVRGDFWERAIDADGCFYDLFVGDGKELYGAAVRTFIQLGQHYETVRIHGFNNGALESLRQVIDNMKGIYAERIDR